MKSLKITDANFTPAGNAYFVDKNEDSFFCTAKTLAKFSLTKDTIKFPLYCNVKVKMYNNLDADRKPIVNADGTPSTFSREDIISIFATAQALAEDHADDFALDIFKEQYVKELRSKAGLTEAGVKDLMDAI